MGSGIHVEAVTLRVIGCSYPLPELLEQAWQATVSIPEPIDLEALIEELQEVVGPEPFELRQRYSYFSWGADNAMLEIVIGLTSGTAVAVIDRLLGAVLRRAGRRDEGPIDGERAASVAREFLAKAREIAPEAVEIDELEPVSAGFRVRLGTAEGERYAVVIDSGGGVHKLTREEAPEPPQERSQGFGDAAADL